MPNVILEAMAMKVPIVATATGGVVEMVENEKEALLVPVENEAALAQSILRLAQDPGLAHKLAARARARVEKEFSENAMIENYKELYLKMARGKN
jgi:glycosyltransferase involved in cell wall biosynthesis